jgi:hypothetical protein
MDGLRRWKGMMKLKRRNCCKLGGRKDSIAARKKSNEKCDMY